MQLPAAKDVHFDIDQYLNPFIPHNRVHRLPKPLSRFLGHREKPATPVGNIIQATWALVGAFCGLTVVTSVFKFAPGLAQYNPPVIIASLGAAAILNYNVIAMPMAQPRNAILGNTLSALTGVCIARLLALSHDSPPDAHHAWLAAPLACGCASLLMTLTSTIYPPGGATAVLAAADGNAAIAGLGWMYVPFVLLGSTLMLGVALVLNNVQRQYPVYWWTPREVGKAARGGKGLDVERDGGGGQGKAEEKDGSEKEGKGVEKEEEHIEARSRGRRRIVITEQQVFVPDGFSFTVLEAQFIELLQSQLRSASDGDEEHQVSQRLSRPESGSGFDVDLGSNGTLNSSGEMLPSSRKSQESSRDER